MATPSIYTPELAEKILYNISNGSTLTAEAKKIGVGRVTAYDWMRKYHPDEYTKAKEDRADHYVDKLFEVAETEPDIQRARLLCDNIKWVACKLLPKMYGDKTQQDVNVAVNYTQYLDELPAPKEMKAVN